jgi:hypothetical protein
MQDHELLLGVPRSPRMKEALKVVLSLAAPL